MGQGPNIHSFDLDLEGLMSCPPPLPSHSASGRSQGGVWSREPWDLMDSLCFKGGRADRGFKCGIAGQEMLCLSLSPEHGGKHRPVPSWAQLPGHPPVAFEHHAHLTLFQTPITPVLGHPRGPGPLRPYALGEGHGHHFLPSSFLSSQ